MKKRFSLLGLLCLGLMIGCHYPAVSVAVDPQQNLKSEIKTLSDEINDVIAQGNCSSVQECKSVAMGNKACGGPAFYLPYSETGTDVKRLLSLAEQHRQKSQRYNKMTGMMSDCMMAMPPALACIEQRCVIKGQ